MAGVAPDSCGRRRYKAADLGRIIGAPTSSRQRSSREREQCRGVTWRGNACVCDAGGGGCDCGGRD